MRRALTGEAGFTLVEVLAAVAVLALGTIAAHRSILYTTEAVAVAPQRLLAGEAALNRLAELRLLGREAALPGTVRQGGLDIALETVIEATTGGLLRAAVTARAPGGTGARFVVFLPGVAQR